MSKPCWWCEYCNKVDSVCECGEVFLDNIKTFSMLEMGESFNTKPWRAKKVSDKEYEITICPCWPEKVGKTYHIKTLSHYSYIIPLGGTNEIL